MTHEDWMRRAIALSLDSVALGGGPFGAVIVKDGAIIGEGANRVTCDNDPTAHAEMLAIRTAARRLADFSLAGAEIYTSCEPCPMCLGAIYWSHLDRIWIANTRDDAAAIGFDDRHIYNQLALPPSKRAVPMRRLLSEEGARAFAAWREKPDKAPY